MNLHIVVKRILLTVLSLATTIVFSAPLHASTLSAREWVDPAIAGLYPGNEYLTYDAQSGLEWLDLGVTREFTYNEILGMTGSGQILEGFRFASHSEVHTLFGNHGIDVSGLNAGWASVNFAEVNEINVFFNFFEITDNAPYKLTAGLYAYDPAEAAYNYCALIWDYAFAAVIDEGQVSPNVINADIGSWLVREGLPSPVPLPGAVWVFMSGLVCLAGARKRK